MEEKMVKVTNRNTGGTGYVLDGGIHRSFNPGETKTIPLSELQALQFDKGGEKILRDYLIIEDKSALEALSMEIEPEYFYTEDDIKEILLNGSLDQLEDTLNFAPKGVIDILKRLAVDLEVPDIRKRDMISEKTGLNISNAIMINHIMAEDDEPKEEEKKVERKVKVEEKKETTTSAPKRKYNVISTK